MSLPPISGYAVGGCSPSRNSVTVMNCSLLTIPVASSGNDTLAFIVDCLFNVVDNSRYEFTAIFIHERVVPMNLTGLAIAGAAAAVAAAINSAAGGGSFISFPTLVFLGVSPITANATNTAAMWIGQAGSIRGFKDDMARPTPRFIFAMIVSGLGGILGAFAAAAHAHARVQRDHPVATALRHTRLRAEPRDSQTGQAQGRGGRRRLVAFDRALRDRDLRRLFRRRPGGS